MATEFRRLFEQKPKAAEALIKTGDSVPDAKLNAVELAAWTMVANTLMNHAKKIWKSEIVNSNYCSDNIASAKLHKKLGFKIIGKVLDGVKLKNKYLDDILVMKNL